MDFSASNLFAPSVVPDGCGLVHETGSLQTKADAAGGATAPTTANSNNFVDIGGFHGPIPLQARPACR